MMMDSTKKLDAMKTAITALADLEAEDQASALRWIAQELGVTGSLQSTPGSSLPSLGGGGNGGDVLTADVTGMSAKQFMAAKKPTTDVERIACLAYYLTHMRDTPHFKTRDLTELNTEAAGRKFGNATQAANNALNQNDFIAPAGKGTRQITSRGEAFVDALPDREKVTAALAEYPKKKRRANSGGRKKTTTGTTRRRKTTTSRKSTAS